MQVDYGTGLDTEHNLHLQSHSHYEHTSNGGAAAFSHFRLSEGPAIDPAIDQQNSSATRDGHAPMSSIHQPSNHLLQPDNASLNSAHMPHQYYGDMPRNSQTPSSPSTASPRFSAISPTSQPKQVTSSFIPSDRSLPSRDVSNDTLDDAYAAFILYCNPKYPTSSDTSDLTKLFRTPPKSDGKSFSTWALFELIRKLDSKEIQTWTRLALDLGVEPPDMEKGQSTQKVQQYSVRLKRWMRAMHIDAFFEYLLGKKHPYYTQIPPPQNPFPENGRDGVPLDEDLAIRALDPQLRPKRGRRKADEGEEAIETVDGTPPRKRPQLDTSIAFGNALQPQSAYPSSAHPDHMEGFLSAHDQWPSSAMTPSSTMTAPSASSRMTPNRNLTPYSASPMSAQQMRWRLNTHNDPTTPHPLSATPISAHPDYFDEPQSAVTPSSSKPRSRRRHGPAVSSAWPSNNASSTGKLRGRPPSNRSVRDGPYVTFPANPNTKEGPTIDMSRNPRTLTPIAEKAHSDPSVPDQNMRFPPTPASAVSPTTIETSLQNNAQKPHRLSLQVPQNPGNPVRLVTPTVLVNGEQDTTPSNDPEGSATGDGRRLPSRDVFDDSLHQRTPQSAPVFRPTLSQAHPSPKSNPSPSSASEPPYISPEALNRALAGELLRAPFAGPKKRLRGVEAKNIASAILQPLYAKSTPGAASSDKAMTDQLLNIVISSCLGLGTSVGLSLGGPTGGVRRVECTRFRVGGDGYESPIDEDEEDAEHVEAENVKESFDIYFSVSFGPLTGEWSIKGLSPTGTDGKDMDASKEDEADTQGGSQNSVASWRAKYLDAQRKLWASQEEAKALREKVLEAVL